MCQPKVLLTKIALISFDLLAISNLDRTLLMHSTFKLTTLTLAVNAALITSVVAQAAVEPLPSVTLPSITVTAETETANGPVDGIAASTVSSTIGTDESILKSTQSVTVVSQQEMQSIGADNTVEAFGYSTGINTFQEADRTGTSFMLRGFQTIGAYRDGQKYQANGFDGKQEVYGLERLEAVKGPASILSGTTSPGGIINAVSKKPSFDNAYEVNAEVGSFNRKQVSTDVNHKINDDVAVRLVGLYRDSDTFVDFVPDDRTYIAPSLTWQPSEETKVTLKADYQHDLTSYVYGLPAEGTVHSTNQGKIDRGFNQGVEGFDKYDNSRYTLAYDVEQKVNPDLLLKHSVQYMDADRDFPYAYSSGLVDGTDSLYKRTAQKRFDKSNQLTGNITAAYDWNAADNIRNVSLFGIDYAKQEHSTERYRGTASNIDFYSPDHSQDAVGDDFKPHPYSSKTENIQTGLFLQNQTTLDNKWVGLLGLRHDRATLEKEGIFDASNKQEGEYSATTGRAGLVYLMENGIAPYASINQSFEVQLGTDRNNELFEPTKGTQYEVGARYQPKGSDTLLTGSLYRIDQTNVLVNDPNNKQGERFKAQLGKVRSQGVELEAKTQISDNSNLIAAYAYTDARTIKSSPATPELEGKRTGNVPYNTLSLWGDYRFTDFGIPQLKVGAGVRYRDSAIGFFNGVEFPSYTLVDAMASYGIDDNWQLSLNANNLLNKEYVTCTYKCFYGEPRNIVGKVTYKW